MNNSKQTQSALDIFLIVFVSYLISFYICLSMNIDPIMCYIFSAMIGFAIGLFFMVTKYNYLESKENVKNMRIQLKNHKIDLRDKGLKAFTQMEIKRDNFSVWEDVFEVKIDGLIGIKGEIVYEQIIQHFEAYPDILKIWNDSKDKVNELNIALEKIIVNLLEKINDKFDKEQDKIRSLLLVSIEWANSSEKIENSDDFDNFLDDINIEIEKNKSVVLKSDNFVSKPISKYFRSLNIQVVSNFLLKIIKSDAIFRKQIKSFTIDYKELKKTFDKDFKTKIKGLLREIGDDVDKLKGECNKCIEMIKKIG